MHNSSGAGSAGRPSWPAVPRKLGRFNWALSLVFLALGCMNYLSLICIEGKTAELAILLFGAVGILQTVIVLVASRDVHLFNLFPLAMMLWAAQFSASGIAIVWLDLPRQYGINDDALAAAVFLSNLCQLVVAFCWKAPPWGRICGRLPVPRFPCLGEARSEILLLWGISVVLRLLLFIKGFRSGFEVEEGTLAVGTNLIFMLSGLLPIFPIIALCGALCSSRKHDKWWVILLLLVEIVFALFLTGTKAGASILLFNFAVAYHHVVKPISFPKSWGLALCILILLVPFYAVKSRVREIARQNSLYGNQSERDTRKSLEIYSEVVGDLKFSDLGTVAEETVEAILMRVDVVTTLAATITYYKDRQYDTGMYLGLWVKPYIPRFVWPEKGWVGLGIFVSENILGITTYTHAAVTSTIEGYIAGGIWGAIALSVIHGTLVAFVSAYLTTRCGRNRNDTLLAVYASLFLVILYFNSSFVFTREIATSVIVVYFCIVTMTKFTKAMRRQV